MSFDPAIPPAARTALDVAIWFLDRARADDSHLPFQKLHHILYLAQSLFAAQMGGILIPAIFLAEELGPTEPNVQRLLAGGRPDEIMIEAPTGKIKDFLESVWGRYAHMPVERMNELMAKNRAYVETGRGNVIDPAAMAAAIVAAMEPPKRSTRVLRSQSGATVAVRAWAPTPVTDSGSFKTRSKP